MSSDFILKVIFRIKYISDLILILIKCYFYLENYFLKFIFNLDIKMKFYSYNMSYKILRNKGKKM